MGLNIFLLLANLAIIEPWRRRRLVKEVRTALEEKTIAAPASPVVERESERSVEPVGVTLEQVAESKHEAETVVADVTGTLDQPVVQEETVGSTPMAAGEVLPEETVEVLEQPTATTAVEESTRSFHTDASPTTWAYWQTRFDMYKDRLHDLFSDRSVTMKRVEVTTIALESVATGLVVMGVLFTLLNPR